MANKLELTWYGKDEPIRVEPRLLIENTALSNTAADPDTQNMLIHGDNLLALKALESKFAGQVKCIYIDPPFNTGQAFENYDDNLEMSIWLDLMRSRLQIIHAQYLLNHLEENRLPSAMLAVTRLLHHMSRIFRDNSVPKSRPGGIQIDRKRLKKLQEKRMALGHKPDDHEEQWPDMTM